MTMITSDELKEIEHNLSAAWYEAKDRVKTYNDLKNAKVTSTPYIQNSTDKGYLNVDDTVRKCWDKCAKAHLELLREEYIVEVKRATYRLRSLYNYYSEICRTHGIEPFYKKDMDEARLVEPKVDESNTDDSNTSK